MESGSTRFLKNLIKAMIPTVRVRGWWRIRNRLKDLDGLEIGGPSPYFEKNGLSPLYPILKRVDHCNLSRQVFEKQREQLPSHSFGKIIESDGLELAGVPSQSYGVIFSSHMLEHTANPLKAILEWKRILRNGGYLLLVLPYKKNTFDHQRQLTPFSHLLDDYHGEVGEGDLTHLQEILKFHDFERDEVHQNSEEMRILAHQNHESRFLHHHVFDIPLTRQVVEWASGRVLMSEIMDPYSFLVLARFF